MFDITNEEYRIIYEGISRSIERFNEMISKGEIVSGQAYPLYQHSPFIVLIMD